MWKYKIAYIKFFCYIMSFTIVALLSKVTVYATETEADELEIHNTDNIVQITEPYQENCVLYKQRTGGISIMAVDNDSYMDELGIVDKRVLFEENGGNISMFSTEEEKWYIATLSHNNVEYVIEELLNHDDIIYAQPNYKYALSDDEIVTDDNLSADGSYTNIELDYQWYLEDVGAFDAWEYLVEIGQTPGNDVVVAVIDTGVNYTHADLINNMWINEDEIPDNDVDDDNNGYIDDIYGGHFLYNAEFENDPSDSNGHGTHVAGIIAMERNETGGTGVAYGSKIMALNVMESSGAIWSSSVTSALEYAKNNGADVINLSLGSYSNSDYLYQEALENAYASGCFVVAAAGNESKATSGSGNKFQEYEDEDYQGTEIDESYPAAYENVLGVMASDKNSDLASYSNWNYTGDSYYEIIAPGGDQDISGAIYSLGLGEDSYAWKIGTSMATPVVAGCAAILKGMYPEESNDEITNRLTELTTKTVTYLDHDDDSHIFKKVNVWESMNITSDEIIISAHNTELILDEVKEIEYSVNLSNYENVNLLICAYGKEDIFADFENNDLSGVESWTSTYLPPDASEVIKFFLLDDYFNPILN